MSREYTNRLLDMLEEGLDVELTLLDCLKYMSEAEVKDMMISNGYLEGVE